MYKSTEELTKTQKRALHVLGFLFLRMGQFARARRLFAALMALDHADINARISLAYASIRLNDGETAIHALGGLSSGVSIPGGDATIHLLLAKAYTLLGDTDMAREETSAFWKTKNSK